MLRKQLGRENQKIKEKTTFQGGPTSHLVSPKFSGEAGLPGKVIPPPGKAKRREEKRDLLPVGV